MLKKVLILLFVFACLALTTPAAAQSSDPFSIQKISLTATAADTVLSPDGHTLAFYEDAGFQNNEVKPDLLPIRLVDLNTGDVLQTLTDGVTDYTSAVAFSSDSKMLASIQQNGWLTIWNPSNGQLMKSYSDALGPHMLAFVPGTHLLLDAPAGNTGLILLWDLDSGSIRQMIQPDFGTYADFQNQVSSGTYPSVTGLFAFPDGITFAETTLNSGVFLGNIISGAETAVVNPSQDVTDTFRRVSPVVTADGKSILYADFKDKQIHILNYTTRLETGQIAVPYVFVTSFFTVAPDSDTLAFLDNSGPDRDSITIHLVSIAKGSSLLDVQIPTKLRGRYQVAFTPDGKQLVVSGFWDLSGEGSDPVYIITLGS